MGNIVLLDDLTINKIAAGEVIERPASVVKEMLENSIDAGADNINIEIKNGGISYIRISDNGKGIQKDDLEIAFERHATSKIRQASDLDVVTSMGFRGEALASIAAISKVEMVSKSEDEEIGNKIVVEAGQTLAFEEAACSKGTTVTVTNLFFNTPVRYKFLKKDFTEAGYIEDVVERTALVHPEIAIKLISNGKQVLQTTGNGKMQDVIYEIYGKDVASAVLDVDYQYDDMHVTGVVGKPQVARSNRSNQIFFVNKRYIKDKTLSGATEKAFKGMIPIGKFGFVILNIEMDQTKVDVNVHPAKLEVRFQESSKVFKAIYHAIQDTLLKAELVASPEREVEDKKEAAEAVKQTNTTSNLFGTFNASGMDDIAKPADGEPLSIIEQIYNARKNQQNGVQEEKETYTVGSSMPSETKTVVADNGTVQHAETTMASDIDSPEAKMASVLAELQKMKADLEAETGISSASASGVQTEATVTTENTTGEDLLIEENEQSQEIPQEPQAEDVTGDTIQMAMVNTENEGEEATEHPQEEVGQASEEANTNTEPQTEEPISEATLEDKTAQIKELEEKIEQLNNIGSAENFDEMYEKLFGEKPASTKEKIAEEKSKIDAFDIISEENSMSVFEPNGEEEANEETRVYTQKPVYKIIGVAFRTYIILEIKDEIYMIDQHAAHERVLYEKVKKNYYSDGDKETQMLLLPDVITLTNKEMDIARDNMDIFKKAGFELEEFGENTIKLNGVPNICYDLNTKDLFLDTLDEINTIARTAKQEIEERFMATVACKAAVKAHMDLSTQEIEQLMDQLLVLPNPFTCPHGRPTTIKMDKKDIEKKFSRRK